VYGLKRAAAVAVGEKHSLAVQRWSAAQLEGMAVVPWLQAAPRSLSESASSSAANFDSLEAAEGGWFLASDGLAEGVALSTPRGLEREPSLADSAASLSPSPSLARTRSSPMRPSPQRASRAVGRGVPSLQRICEEEVARCLVDPRTCLQASQRLLCLCHRHRLLRVDTRLQSCMACATVFFLCWPGLIVSSAY
jgi:hypothetical protein